MTHRVYKNADFSVEHLKQNATQAAFLKAKGTGQAPLESVEIPALKSEQIYCHSDVSTAHVKT